MRVFKTLLISVLAVCTAHRALSQDEFKDGFIVKNDQQYVYGYISVTATPHASCIFKEKKDETPVTYTPEQIAAYGILNGNHFRKRSIIPTGETEVRPVFLEAVADGVAVLYHTFGRIFIERGESFYELKNEKGKEANYRSIIGSLLDDCPYTARKVKSVPIELNALTALVRAHNECLSNSTSRTRLTGSLKYLEIFAGTERMQLSASGATGKFPDGQKFTDRTLVHGGLNFRLKPLALKHFSFVTGLWFNDQKLYLISREPAAGDHDVSVYRANYKLVKLPFFIQVDNLVQSALQPYVKGGISIPVILSRDVTLSRETENNNVVYRDRYKISKNFREPLQVQIAAGASIPLTGKLHVFAEAFFSGGKNEFTLKAPIGGVATGNFKSMGLNIGLTIH